MYDLLAVKRTIELVTNNVCVNSTDFVKSLLDTSRVFDNFVITSL